MPRSSSMGIRHLLQHWSRLPLLKKPDIDSEVDASRKEYAAEDYSQYMRMAIDLGKYSKAEDDKPRPKVGAVVIKGGTLLGCAYRENKHLETTPNIHFWGEDCQKPI